MQLTKKAMFLVLYHPKLFGGRIRSAAYCFNCLISIAKVCNEQGILISDLPKFPHVHQDVAKALQNASYKIYINFLHKLQLHADTLNFAITDQRMLAFLASQQKGWEKIQTPYIPPRIWTYQINRLNECLDDFLEHQAAIEKAFTWISDAYEHNSAALPQHDRFQSPFGEHRFYKKKRILFDGGFDEFLAEYGLLDLFERWMGSEKQRSVAQFARYFRMVRDASLLYILNFSLQRVSEAMSLRADCFLIEQDERLGEIALIVGETTKTDPDDDARWVVPRSVKKAVDVAASIAKLQMRHYTEDVSASDAVKASTLLALPGREPWTPRKTHSRNVHGELAAMVRLGPFIASYPRVFDPKEITVTESDWKIAVSMTPNLSKKSGFGVGLPWQFTVHQLRRTTSVNMFASNMVSDNSLQWIMKHLSRNMTLYYGRNYTNLRLNSAAETAVIIESYKAIYRQLVDVLTDSVEYVKPHRKEMIPSKVINLVETREERQLTKLIKQGAIGCRRTLLGYCMKPGYCEYGGIESVAKCAGGDGGGICADAIFERKNEAKLRRLKVAHEKEMESLDPDSPRYSAIKQEVYAIGVYLDAINEQENR
ncbi:hypothetical protein [Pseudomonas aeruginosa]|uniref:hypothetical protein n=1 Tax=Pseudomonas aeruginosa TaxID=287 RepID=UPI0015C578FF|nr:hypothetical protein [Pseudomonas aeruginosa]MDK4762906.1 hypothetical protein [Pseudomonas aeruginosa]MDK4852534.1 hypothetical protein [Pseudomonas aeruginosa]MDK4873398.1 hypothetical protein [Pseudomonas aeruginosa]MDK4879816.1 hypothetical protein [Pseudomonas aeruginosa]MDK4894874.1 hypothetical protein [Pseudomonas aeruginosa]